MKRLTHILVLFLLTLASCNGQTKYFQPTGIVDKTKELSGKNIWTKLNDKERIDGYTRIGNSIYGGEIACDVKPLNNIDIHSFKVLAGTQYAKDTNHVYYPLEVRNGSEKRIDIAKSNREARISIYGNNINEKDPSLYDFIKDNLIEIDRRYLILAIYLDNISKKDFKKMTITYGLWEKNNSSVRIEKKFEFTVDE